MTHYPVRMDNAPGQPAHFVGLCGYESHNPKEFCKPQENKATCEACHDYPKVEVTEWKIELFGSGETTQ